MFIFFSHSQLQRPDNAEQKSSMEDYYQSCMDALCFSTSTSLAVTVKPTNLVFNVKTSSSVSASWTSAQTVSVSNHTKEELRYTAHHAG